MRTYCVVALVSLVGCKSESKSKPPPASEPEVAKETVHEIAKHPRTAMASSTGFLELTIDLPPEASMPRKRSGETSWSFKDSKLELAITERSEQPSQQPNKGGIAPDPSTKTTRKVAEELGAYVVVDRKDDATGFRLEYCRDLDPAQPPSGVCCEMKLASQAPIIDIDKLIMFADDVCRSIKIKNR